MENGGGQSRNDFYAILGLNNDCTPAELRNAYKKLALRWHPDRCSGSETAKKKFQAIQRAYSVLSDANKRLLYDVGAYDSDDDDDEDGMAEFLHKMVDMMDQVDSNGNGEESFEEFQQLFEELVHDDLPAFSGWPSTSSSPWSSSSTNNASSCASNGHNPGKTTGGTSYQFNGRGAPNFYSRGGEDRPGCPKKGSKGRSPEGATGSKHTDG